MALRLQDGGGNHHVFRSYSASPSPHQQHTPRPAATCQIWEVVRATSAMPTFFSAVNIDGDRFIDGGVGINNPTREALNEIRESRQDGSAKPLIISIGSGLRPQMKIPRTSSSVSSSILTKRQALKSIATDTEDVHEQMRHASEAEGFDYFRFNVDSGLEDLLLDSWKVKRIHGEKVFKTIETITLETESYLQKVEVVEKLRRCAQILVNSHR